jgi:hypothetical protein
MKLLSSNSSHTKKERKEGRKSNYDREKRGQREREREGGKEVGKEKKGGEERTGEEKGNCDREKRFLQGIPMTNIIKKILEATSKLG